MSRKQGKGRKKTILQKILNQHHLKTTFTKRRKGLFKKSDELCNNFGIKIGVFTFSPYGRAYGFGNPSEIDVINGVYAQDCNVEQFATNEVREESGRDGGFWWQKSPEDVEFSEFEDFKDLLSDLKKNVINRIEDLQMRRRALRDLFV